jgi:hypothetical protein
MAKRWAKERKEDDGELSDELFEEMLGTMLPIACAGEKREKRGHLMFPGDSPYEGGIFMGNGWTSVAAVDHPAVNFLCPDCFQREVEQNHVTSKQRTTAHPPVPG